MNMLSKILNTLFWVITIPLVAYLFFSLSLQDYFQTLTHAKR